MVPMSKPRRSSSVSGSSRPRTTTPRWRSPGPVRPATRSRSGNLPATHERTAGAGGAFFRHEFGRLVALLTRWLGVRRLELAEDVVQAALTQALQTWSRRGVPSDAAGWLYRTVRNLAIDALRPERTHSQSTRAVRIHRTKT